MTFNDVQGATSRTQASPNKISSDDEPKPSSYKKSAALAFQISLANFHSVDYCVFVDNRKTLDVMFGTDHVGDVVRKAKAQAISTGNQKAVAFLAHHLSVAASEAGVPREHVFEQLSREYRFDVAATVKTLELWAGSQ